MDQHKHTQISSTNCTPNNRAQRKAHKYQVKEQRKTTNWANRNKRPHSNLQRFHSEALALWTRWRRRWAVPVSLKARPYLASCIAFDFKKIVFRALVLIFFSPNVPSPSRPKCPCANRFSFLGKRGKTVGILALGPNKRGLCFHPGICWFSRGPSELGKVLSEKNAKIRVTCRKP